MTLFKLLLRLLALLIEVLLLLGGFLWWGRFNRILAQISPVLMVLLCIVACLICLAQVEAYWRARKRVEP